MGDAKGSIVKERLLRCADWLEKQNSEDPDKLALQNKNDIQFIIQTHAARKDFLLAVAEDDATVPAGVLEPSIEPVKVRRSELRVSNLRMECEWQGCRYIFYDYEEYQKHVRNHASEIHAIETKSGVEYVCLWDVCGHKTADFNEVIRHMSFHAYHGKLLASGLNARVSLNLDRCKKDSSKRNQIPVQPSDYKCMWIDCDETYNSYQLFLTHVVVHVNYADSTCSWAGCGMKFPRRSALVAHVKSHTGEKHIACYHCGLHFATNRKLADHTRRQNVHPNSPFVCDLCGMRYASEYLLAEHARQHISTYACTLCDMSTTGPAALANHMRYRHLSDEVTRIHPCPLCDYRAIKKWDLKMHIKTHKNKKRKKGITKTKRAKIKTEIEEESDRDEMEYEFEKFSDDDEEDADAESVWKFRDDVKPNRTAKYICHMCPEKKVMRYSRGSRLTKHLVKEHGAQWSYGHSRFSYRRCEDGLYRLKTTRYESLEVSKKIMDTANAHQYDYNKPKMVFDNIDFKINKVADPTENTPTRFEISLQKSQDNGTKDNEVEIFMCDVDEEGNIISSEVINTDVLNKIEVDPLSGVEMKEYTKGKTK